MGSKGEVTNGGKDKVELSLKERERSFVELQNPLKMDRST
jgi:hypothetical protein